MSIERCPDQVHVHTDCRIRRGWHWRCPIVGVYGVMAYSVSAAHPRDCDSNGARGPGGDRLGMIVSKTARLTAVGLAIGAAGRWRSRACCPGCYSACAVGPADVCRCVALLGVAAIAAGTIPAIRATRIDSVEALKS